MNIVSIILFVSIMSALAAMPSASVALVVTRSATRGFANGLAVAAGIVLADLVFATLAIVGMTAFAQSAGMLFSAARYLAGAYIIFLGYTLIRSRNEVSVRADARPTTLLTSMLSGLLLTFGDVKAILFYASLFPALFDLRAFTLADTAMVLALTAFIVGGVKVAYAALAQRIILRWNGNRMSKHAKSVAGGIMIGTGIAVVVKT